MTHPAPGARTPGPLPTGPVPAPSTPGTAGPTPPPTGTAPAPFPSAPSPEDFPTTVGNDGRIAWALGLLGVLGFPVIAALAMSITMIVLGLLQRKKNPVAARTGRNAAIFGATVLASVPIFFGLLFFGLPREPTPEPPIAALIAIPFGIWMILGGPITGVVMGIIALVRPVSRDRAAKILATTPVPSPPGH